MQLLNIFFVHIFCFNNKRVNKQLKLILECCKYYLIVVYTSLKTTSRCYKRRVETRTFYFVELSLRGSGFLETK